VTTTDVTIYIGGVFASRDGATVRTLLGSCVSACLWDRQNGVGGMNHFMLPRPADGDSGDDLARFGVHAMELLIGKIQRLGGDRRTVQAKIFGGGHVLHITGVGGSVPEQNIRFVRRFLSQEGIPVVAVDLGGDQARQVVFCTESGRAWLKRLPASRFPRVEAEQAHQREAAHIQANVGAVTLFDDEGGSNG
jgi:chemotaxis receptor (MCP) glutamine deamidase CheD